MRTCPFTDVNGQLLPTLLLDVLGMFIGQAPGRGMINVFWYSGSESKMNILDIVLKIKIFKIFDF